MVKFRGREFINTETGLEKLKSLIRDIAKVELAPKQEENQNFSVLIASIDSMFI